MGINANLRENEMTGWIYCHLDTESEKSVHSVINATTN